MTKKIIILVDSLKIGSGSDRVAAILGTELNNEGYEVTFLTLMDGEPKYPFKGEYKTLNEKDIYGNNLKRFIGLLKHSPKVAHICRELEIDTVISAGDPANFHALISRLAYGNRSRIIISQHMNPEIFLNSRFKYNLIKFFYPQAYKTVCVSKEIERILNEQYGVRNTRTIYNMMDIKENIELAKEELPIQWKKLFNEKHSKAQEENFNFINLGRLDRQKGQWFLIRSFKKVVEKNPNARLFILGEGELKEKLKKLIAVLKLEKNVFLLGEQENIFPFLLNSHCFILSSLWEGLPMSLIEALSLNLPVISTDCKTGPREILCPELELKEEVNYPYFGNYAILIPPFPNELLLNNITEQPIIKTEAALSDLMTLIIEDETLRNKYSNGQKLAYNFDKEKILGQWKKLLN
ncbi:MAG: glycosyltransferase [Methanobacterium sp.]|nr:glycosyltransferase [Methanobacterium sp.]